MKKLIVMILAAVGILSLAYAEPVNWKQEVDVEVSRLGHRNMVIVADSAYPIQIGAGVRVISTDADHLAMVRHVTELIARSKAVRPLIAIDKEFAYIPEKYAPGAAKLREEVMAAIKGKSAQALREVLHGTLLQEVNMISEEYEVVVFKTSGTIPYSSVFFTLDCGYWSAEAESALREKMEKAK